MKRTLLLEDGTTFVGEAFGADRVTVGELVFTTGMTGYQEGITDPSFNGQIIVFTYPLIGNVGINRDDFESIEPSCKGVVVRELARRASNWRNNLSLDEFLAQKGIPGISGIDTRALTKIIRERGAIKATLIDGEKDAEHSLDQLRATVMPKKLVAEVSTTKAYPSPGLGKNVVVIDFGLKHSILRELSRYQCQVTVLPHNATAEQVLALAPDGVLLSNGPGDPEEVPEALTLIREIQGKVPLFGICLGHQLFSLANGAKTYKLPFGHRGSNHPVREIATGRIDFTSQNHGYAVSKESLEETDLIVTHVEVNDETVEGVKHRLYPAFSVQFHPDAAPGPHDAHHVIEEFIELMDAWKESN
ncbi:carbamoyl phosphate synthase small subunit [Vagococcus xieshaowenii]|uniref:Carbamoyl phosphate synthase small chain n=1 Tax=Vagococcus xieshaowenii TaxID=2562451 RepID=A0A4Z0D6T2_9ENTE|nr:carbamoyl phosphate synthase small subunit [Vagococcus xieshaowenii]QCA28592.1 glutamine-hydrolyzing carbamoyl-phosphate synthase small subunit [Vagococcus xieshaowenii]TFZ40600.1 glutamine-hydrolyzing carbamoyl-phosphate synthase small subunit [Vagococcus xieshaowenii]